MNNKNEVNTCSYAEGYQKENNFIELAIDPVNNNSITEIFLKDYNLNISDIIYGPVHNIIILI